MLRSLIKNWQLNSIAVFSLAIAMALGVVALSIANVFLLRPPLARDAGQLVTVYAADRAHGGNPGDFSYAEYQYVRDHSRSFSGVAAFNYGYSKGTVSFGSRDEMVMGNTVSDNYFQVMGIEPLLGRFFTPGDDAKRTASVVLTYACWKRWGADRAIVGKTVKTGGRQVPIIGVAPKAFLAPVFAIGADLIQNFGDVGPDDHQLEDRKDFRYLLIGRLGARSGRPQARAEIQSLWGQLAAEYPEPAQNRAPVVTGMSVLPPASVATGRVISAVLIACALLILLIACANTANLLLALATLRRQEALIKTALGASRGRLIREIGRASC